MASIAVFASGGGSNFRAILTAFQQSPHRVAVLVCDRKNAGAVEIAREAEIPVLAIRYSKERSREEIERELLTRLKEYPVELIALAGFMRLLSPVLIDAYPGRILNLHPSLLPKYPGTKGIEESYYSGDAELGITIHQVDYGLDTGPILQQGVIPRISGESLKDFEVRIHALEHRLYPDVILTILNGRRPSPRLVCASDTHVDYPTNAT